MLAPPAAGLSLAEEEDHSPPSVELVTAWTEVVPGGRATLTATAWDEYGGPVESFEWAATAGSVSAHEVWPGADEATATWTAPLETGDVVITVTVTDSGGLVASDSATITVTASAAPWVTMTAEPDLVIPGGPVRLTATAGDPDGGSVTYAWSAPSGTFDATDAATATWTAPSEEDTVDVRVEVTDDEGEKASAVEIVLVRYDEELTLAPSDVVALEFTDMRVTVAGAMPLSTSYLVNSWACGHWTSGSEDLPIVIDGAGGAVVDTRFFAYQPDEDGDCTISLHLNHPGGGTSSQANVNLFIRRSASPPPDDPPPDDPPPDDPPPDDPPPDDPPPNEPPRVVVRGAPLEVEIDEAVALIADAGDADGSVAGYRWTATAGRLDVADRRRTTWTAPGEPGDVKIGVTVTDDDGATASDAVTVAVVRPPDLIPSFDSGVGDQTFTVGVTARVELPAASGGDGALSYSLAPALPAGLSFNAKSRVIWGTPVAEVGRTTYTLTATDDDREQLDSATLQLAIEVVPAPEEPAQRRLRVTPAGPNSVGVFPGSGWSGISAPVVAVEARGPRHGWIELGTVPSESLGNSAALSAAPTAQARAVVSKASAAGVLLIRGLDAETPYTFRLRRPAEGGGIEYSEEASATTGAFGGPCRSGTGYLCLRERRFELQAHWTNPDTEGDFGGAAAVRAPISDESGLFWFFNPANVELVAKVLDGIALNGHYWVFFGALSDVEYWLTATDTATAVTRTYHNRPKEICGQGDTDAFPEQAPEAASNGSRIALSRSGSPGGPWRKSASHRERSGVRPGGGLGAGRRRAGIFGVDLLRMDPEAFETADAGSQGDALGAQETAACEPSKDRLCLLGNRFGAGIRLVDPNVTTSASRERAAQVIPSMTTEETGFFWFFNPENIEVAVKVLDGTALNGHFWVLYGGLSDVEYTIEVTDTWTGTTRVYRNPPGSLCGGIDIEALP